RRDEVTPTLEPAEAAAAEGLHAVGFVAYEAAAAFDPALRTLPPDPPLPLAWFAVYAGRDEASLDDEPESRHPEARPLDADHHTDGGRAEGASRGSGGGRLP